MSGDVVTLSVFPELRITASFDPRIFSEGRELNMWGDPLDMGDIISHVIHDAGKGSDAASTRLGALSQTLTEVLPEYNNQKQTFFNTPALLGEMGAETALTEWYWRSVMPIISVAIRWWPARPILIARQRSLWSRRER
ncbi:hypothetical protein WJ33_30300 [Burkholderia ubonensis]|uniref:Uncharacterized protein n=1 Tax=Burkholderia ubonensis TaxID=101571 RepID=A0A103R6I2_9BURK|nr:hypothetical protein WJ33_30300 [Burkholderia ubonensis]